MTHVCSLSFQDQGTQAATNEGKFKCNRKVGARKERGLKEADKRSTNGEGSSNDEKMLERHQIWHIRQQRNQKPVKMRAPKEMVPYKDEVVVQDTVE